MKPNSYIIVWLERNICILLLFARIFVRYAFQSCTFRLETRAREFFVMASLKVLSL